MSAKIIDPDRYKKTTRKRAKKEKEIFKEKIALDTDSYIPTKNGYGNNNVKYEEKFEYTFLNDKLNKNLDNKNIRKNKVKNKNENISKNNKNNNRQKSKNSFGFKKIVYVFSSIFILILISLLSSILVNRKNDNIFVSSNNNENISLVQDYDFVIGMNKLDTNDIYKTQNVLLNELVNLSSNCLIKINKDYSIKNKVAKNIDKINSKEYVIEIDPICNVTIEEIFESINEFKRIKESIYFEFANNIEELEKIENTKFKVRLKNDDSYFVYKLDFPIIKSKKNVEYNIDKDKNDILLNKNSSKSTLNTIRLKGYSDSDDLIEDFKNYKVDMFTTSSDSLTNLIGKHEYSIKKYRDGKSLFLLGNKDSNLFKKNEVRKALAYSLNRDEIIKEINPLFMEIIDIPYIYSDVKIKYDTIGAENVLKSQGWKKIAGLYRLNENGKTINLELKLLVNENDSTKVYVADKVKEMAEKIGIKINVLKLKDELFNESLKNKNYDIVLADVYINNVPDIGFLEEYLNINNEINSCINIFKNSSVNDLNKNLISLQNILSSEVACIGIYASDTNIVYQKNIIGFSDLGYMKVFDNIEKIGKLQNINNKSNNK